MLRAQNLVMVVVVLCSPTVSLADVSCASLADRAIARLPTSAAAAADMQRRARRAALLPSVRMRGSYTDQSGQYWPSTDAANDWSYRNGRQIRVDLELRWELPHLVWHHDELAIARERDRLADRRRALRRDVIVLCAERDDTLAELERAPAAERPALAARARRLDAELAALADEAAPP